MNSIYHEKQEGSLCGQHCLNNLLQGEYFSAVDLATIAQDMDKQEQLHMAEQGMDTEEYRKFMEQPSSNMDDSGMFSVQVLTSALKIWNLNLVPFTSSNQLSRGARANPIGQAAYVCNFKEHWFTVRKLGQQWFNLNSLLTFPELISDTYLALFLTQLQHEGYSIFIVEGTMPSCQANEELMLTIAVQTEKPKLLSEKRRSSQNYEHNLQEALKASLLKAGNPSTSSQTQEIPNDLERAIALSMGATEGRTSDDSDSDMDLAKALQMSLQEQSPEKKPDLDDLRLKRLKFLENTDKDKP